MSSKSYSNTIRLVSYVIGLLMLVEVVLMFVPYYNDGTNTTSIQGYIWTQYNTFKAYFTEHIDGYSINSQVGMPILTMVLGLVGVVMNVAYPEKMRALVFSAAYAIAGIWCFLSTATLKLGSLYIVHLLLIIVVAVLTVLNIVQTVLESRSRIRA